MAAGHLGATMQYYCSAVAVLFNLYVIFLVLCVPTKLGSYKYFMLYFCVFELFYAILGWFVLMVFTIYDHRIVAYSASEFLADTPLGAGIVGLYCAMYQVWMVYVAIMFVCRYFVVCRDEWYQKIKSSPLLQKLLILLYLCQFAYSVHCGVYWCTAVKVPVGIEQQFRYEFNKTHWTNHLSVMIITLLDETDTLSLSGFMLIFNHLFFVGITSICILYCGRKMQQAIHLMKNSPAEYARNRQIFITPVLQAVIPLVFYHIPSVSIISYIIFEGDSQSKLGSFLCQITLAFIIPKVLDPLCVIFVIREYRTATINIFTGRWGHVRSKAKICNTRNYNSTLNTSALYSKF